MTQGLLPIGNTLRLATIVNVEKTFVQCRFLGKFGEEPFDCPIPQPYAGKGGGFLAGPERDTMVLVSEGPMEQKFIVAFVPIRSQYFDQEGVGDVDFNHTPYPILDEGELMIKSAGGSYLGIHPDGDIRIDAKAGELDADFEISGSTRAMFFRTDNRYAFSEAGRYIEGLIKRDKHQKEDPIDTKSMDFLSGEAYDEYLETIGRMPQDESMSHTAKISRNFIRNPPLVEKREITYEYANSSEVGKLSDEVRLMMANDKEDYSGKVSGLRSDRRTDVLNLNMRNYNHLIEKVEGTLVDIYGNPLDINRNKIEIPDLDALGYSSNETAISNVLDVIHQYMRRSVKYHFEINSRKEIIGDEPSRGGDGIQQREHSRWSIDVDGEGLTKINIPATSETGNIPVLSRYITSRDDTNEFTKDDGNFRDKNSRDIRILPFGNGGPAITDSSYKPETINNSSVTAGTAYHDLMKVADSIFSSGAWGKLGPRMSSEIQNKISDKKSIESNSPNAGGRSMHANLDGSLELSIGSDSVDSKSLLLDLEGGVVSHYGSDKNGRSIIHQSDGSVLIQIGGTSQDGKIGSPGRLEIHLSDGTGGAQKIIIDEGGMTFDVKGSIILNASNNIGINAGAEVMINGAHAAFFGSVDATPGGTRTVTPGSVTIIPAGLPHVGILG